MTGLRPAWAEVDLDAVRANVGALAAVAAPAELLAVVKADGYGHGAVPVARAALDAGARRLGVALVEEGLELRAAGIEAPVLVLSEPVADAAPAVVEHRLTPTVYTESGIEALAKAVAERGAAALPVHLKVDTGMHRVGCRSQDARALAASITRHRELVLEGVMTHLAVADEPADPYTDQQLDAFEAVLAELAANDLRPGLVHAANTAGALAFPRARYDLVRVGIGLYGIPPSASLAGRVALRPALSLRARVSHVQRRGPGDRVSYGLRHTFADAATVATVPVGYGDGVPRNLGLRGGAVLVDGRRCPITGAVTMDQLMADCDDRDVEVGDDVVLIGRQGDEEVTAAEWAERMGTIAYEIVCAVGRRLPRRYRS